MTDNEWDDLLHIKTTGRDDSHADACGYPYEPTPYAVLERLANTGYIRKGNTLLDYGCGKGRVDFFLSWQTRCRSIGVEYDRRIYEKARDNMKTGAAAGRVSFVLAHAEDYAVPQEVDRIYFFNPFSLSVLQNAMHQILESCHQAPRDILLCFYYPSDSYMEYLQTVRDLVLYDDIDCRDLEEQHERERIVIFLLRGTSHGND